MEIFVIGPLNTNCYVIWSRDEGIIIDIGGDPEPIISFLNKEGIIPKYIISTHGHFDHVMGIGKFKKYFDAKFLIHSNDLKLVNYAKSMAREFLDIEIDEIPHPDGFIKEGDIITVGDFKAKVIETPGHTLGSICLLINDSLFTGDTLFAGTIGRTDLGGSEELMMQTLKRLKKLDDKLKIFPGHGPPSILGYEKKYNPFLVEVN
jgi:glyoxylase-like metal-dependent hydrolase (beta-lactamase superfamily II)